MSQPTVNSTCDNFLNRQANQTCPQFSEDVSVKAVKILGYSLVLIISLLGNSIITATVARNKRMQTAVNYFIANMAASDLLISTFAVPIQLSEIAIGPRRWLMDGTVGLISCKLAYFFQDISTAVSIQSLVVIAVDRHRAIVFPFRPAIVTRKRCKFIIPLIWLSSMGLHAIYFYTWRIISDNGKTCCIASWEPAFHPQEAQELYIIIVLVFIVMLPFTIITALYSQIIWSLWKEGLRRASSSSQFSRRRHKENIKVITYICAIIVAFWFCVIPIYVYTILFYFVWKWRMPCGVEQYGFVAHFILFSNAAITPMITFTFNDKYRRALKRFFQNRSANGRTDQIELVAGGVRIT